MATLRSQLWPGYYGYHRSNTPIYGSGEGSEKFKANLARNVLFPKRLGYADELASMVAELVTNDYMNGETLRVDGGIRMPPK